MYISHTKEYHVRKLAVTCLPRGVFDDVVMNIYCSLDSLVVRASDSRPEGLVHAEIVEVEMGGVAIYRPFGEFRRAKSYCHLYVFKANDRRTSSPLQRGVSWASI
ncbi:hypothetical protein TNCV_3910241 [Trichonephila clavipes]|nr:hypothetical protein TNCV_3910241 [Trichonephila clavipes]